MSTLTSPFNITGLDDIKLLYDLKRYSDCAAYCDAFIDKTLFSANYDQTKAQVYRAKSMYYMYSSELMEKVERQNYMPGFEYKEMMRSFCKNHVIQVIRTLAQVKNQGGNITQDLYDNEAAYMLDKALTDYIIFNTKEVSICLLCHERAQKLVHSHYIPKCILQEFVKALGLDPGESVFVYSPSYHPSNWQLQSATKATFSMLCKTCDGTILSKDENLFKANFFNVIHRHNSRSHLEEHLITYSQYLYTFAAGLMFRNIALCSSDVCAEVGEFKELYLLMQSCREIVLGTPSSKLKPKIYILTLPLELPSSLPQIYGWNKYVMMVNSPYAAYKLLQPGEPMVPKVMYCFMVKIGVLVFVMSLDADFDKELEKMCSLFEIQSASEVTDCKFTITIPGNSERSQYFPQRLWWSLIGWAKKEINMASSVGLSVKQPTKISRKFQVGAWVEDLLNSATHQQVCANLLPPGFELNFEKFNTLPDKVIVVPDGHAILLHCSLKTKSDAKVYVVIGKKITDTKKSDKQPLYSIKKLPYVLVCLEDARKKFVIKTGYFIDDICLNVKEALPGVPVSMKESLELKELIEQLPSIISAVLHEKGFISLKSLLHWQEFFFNRESNK